MFVVVALTSEAFFEIALPVSSFAEAYQFAGLLHFSPVPF